MILDELLEDPEKLGKRIIDESVRCLSEIDKVIKDLEDEVTDVFLKGLNTFTVEPELAFEYAMNELLTMIQNEEDKEKDGNLYDRLSHKGKQALRVFIALKRSR